MIDLIFQVMKTETNHLDKINSRLLIEFFLLKINVIYYTYLSHIERNDCHIMNSKKKHVYQFCVIFYYC